MLLNDRRRRRSLMMFEVLDFIVFVVKQTLKLLDFMRRLEYRALESFRKTLRIPTFFQKEQIVSHALYFILEFRDAIGHQVELAQPFASLQLTLFVARLLPHDEAGREETNSNASGKEMETESSCRCSKIGHVAF